MHARVRLLLPLLAAVCFASTARADEPKPASMLGAEPGQVRDDNGLGMKLVWCPPGFVTMERASGDEITPVKVFLSRGYWMGQYEVTRAEWKRLMMTEPWSRQPGIGGQDDNPATIMTWDSALEFCRKFTDLERAARHIPDNWEYTLPTEAQWERACRAQTETAFSFGDGDGNPKLDDYAWYLGNSGIDGHLSLHPVGGKKANAWGLYDMHGNVWEWCSDSYTTVIPGGRDPKVEIRYADRTERGGSYSQEPAQCRSATRRRAHPDTKRSDLGFRVALTPGRPADTPAK